ncbi:RsmB/NOP family class I SAM-dependent RNA methyltransferase [Frigidibacter oleivorans]|uniref:RsmB/NOP family class I SAM-dependent RNA methyltransferase n=1 Tax=Frigidibacter oleivorans TaxID=2487129 RepID=UPI000F8C828C|nr:RsmB/NOP family class I SAM-dependent RNA methyltransferase [Frigidibacter oleivorans]
MARNDPSDPRGAAAALVAAVTGEGRLLSDLLAEGALDALPPSGRARAQRLALDTLRQLSRADRVLKPFLRRAPPAPVLAVLRVATVEMLALGAPGHGVVGAAVAGLGRDPQTEGFTGLANAVLRKVAALDPGAWAALPVTELPSWLRGRLMSAWGKRATQAMEAAHLAGAPLDLTPKDGDAAALAAAVGGTALPTGSVRLAAGAQVSELPGYAAGDWWVQDAAAAIPARLLAARAGETVADLCAAPGGKTLQLAAAGARVTAVDLSAARLARLEENLARCGLTAQVVAADARDWRPGAPLDAVLLDAPCSATGTIRRHPDLPHARTGEGLRDLFALQAAMLDHALTLLRPGGRLVYCTCSLLPEEGEAQIAALRDRHPGLESALPDAGWIEEGWRSGPDALRLRPDFWPDQGGMDGFFAAALRLPG